LKILTAPRVSKR